MYEIVPHISLLITDVFKGINYISIPLEIMTSRGIEVNEFA